MSKLKSLLEDLVKVDGTRVAMVVDWDGFVIEGASKDLAFELDAIGAVISTSLGSTQVIGRELQVGSVNLAMLEFDKGTVLVRVLGRQGILAVLVDPQATLGLIRHHIRKYAPELEVALG